MPSTLYIQYIQEDFEFQHLHVQWTPPNGDSDKGDFLLNGMFSVVTDSVHTHSTA